MADPHIVFARRGHPINDQAVAADIAVDCSSDAALSGLPSGEVNTTRPLRGIGQIDEDFGGR